MFVYAHHTQLRGNHYFLRSMANILEKCKNWQKAGPKILADLGADRFYDTVFDGSALPYAMQVRQRLEHLAARYNWAEEAARR